MYSSGYSGRTEKYCLASVYMSSCGAVGTQISISFFVYLGLSTTFGRLPSRLLSLCPQLRDFIASGNVDRMGSTGGAVQSKISQSSEYLLKKAMESGDVGLFEDAVKCVLGREGRDKAKKVSRHFCFL